MNGARSRRERLYVLSGCAGALLFCLVLWAPSALQTLYRNGTAEATFQKRARDYWQLANAESSLSGPPLAASYDRRSRIKRWFLVRGRDIDEGHGKTDVWDHWGDLIEYWRQEDDASGPEAPPKPRP